MLFAAGFGTRMAELTKDRPKPLLPFKGRALIDYAMDHVNGFAPHKTVVNAHYHADQVMAHFANTPVIVRNEQPQVLETGGGLKAACGDLEKPTVVTMNSDTLWSGDNPILHLAQAWDPDRMDALLLCVPTDLAIGHTGKGDFAIDPTGRISRGGPYTYASVQIIKTSTLAEISETVFSLNVIWDILIGRGRAFASLYSAPFYDIGTKDSFYAAANEL